MNLKDKLNLVAQATSALKQAESNLASAVASLGTVQGDGDAAIAEGQALKFDEDQSVFVVQGGKITKFPLLTP